MRLVISLLLRLRSAYYYACGQLITTLAISLFCHHYAYSQLERVVERRESHISRCECMIHGMIDDGRHGRGRAE